MFDIFSFFEFKVRTCSFLAYRKNGTQDPERTQDPVRTEDLMWTQDPMRTQNPMRTQDPRKTKDCKGMQDPIRAQELKRTQNPIRTRTLWGPRTLGGLSALWVCRTLWWPRKKAGTYKLAKVSWFPHHVFNLVKFEIKGWFSFNCWMQINLTFFVKLKIC